MGYHHKIIQNHPRITIWEFDNAVPYIPNVEDVIFFPEDWKDGTRFKITSVHHYPVDKLIVINVNRYE